MRKTRKMSLGIKSVIIICSMVAILGAVLGTITAIVFDRTIDTEFESKVTDLAHTTAVSLNGDNVKLLRDEIVEIYEAQEEKVGSDGMGTPAHEKYIANFMPLKETAEYKELRKLVNDIFG